MVWVVRYTRHAAGASGVAVIENALIRYLRLSLLDALEANGCYSPASLAERMRSPEVWTLATQIYGNN